jgi:outer membrane lipoprotein-sorting protein
MTPNSYDDDQLEALLTASYDRLRQPDAAGRQSLLAELSPQPARSGRRGTSRRAWQVGKLSLATAACILVLAAVRLFAPSATGTLYGIEEVGRRMCEVKTIRIRGWQYFYNDERPTDPPIRIPVEYLIKRPDKYRSTWYAVSKGQTVNVRSGPVACNGRRVTSFDDTNKTFESHAISPLDAWLAVESRGQGFVTGTAADGFKKTGEGHCNGRKCDLYEGQFDDESGSRRTKLWFDPTTGFALRLTEDELQSDGVFRRDTEWEEILVNVPLDDPLFDLTVPDGYKRRGPAPQEPEPPPPVLRATPKGSGEGGGQKLEMWEALRIADNAALVVWRRSPPEPAADGTRDWLSNIAWKLPREASGLTVQHAWLYNSKSPDVWNWSLVVVSGGRWPDPGNLDLQLHAQRSELNLGMLALWFPDDQLRKILTAAADVMLPADAPRFSLETMRAKAEALSREKIVP